MTELREALEGLKINWLYFTIFCIQQVGNKNVVFPYKIA